MSISFLKIKVLISFSNIIHFYFFTFSSFSCSGLRFRRFRGPSARPAGPLRKTPPKRVVPSGPETGQSVSKPLSRTMMDPAALPKPDFGPVRAGGPSGVISGIPAET